MPSCGAAAAPRTGWKRAVEWVALPLQAVHGIIHSHRLTTCVLGVRDRVADHILKEDLEHAARLLVDEPRGALDATAAREPPDGRFGDALDVVA